jgi:hypothetical protein
MKHLAEYTALGAQLEETHVNFWTEDDYLIIT